MFKSYLQFLCTVAECRKMSLPYGLIQELPNQFLNIQKLFGTVFFFFNFQILSFNVKISGAGGKNDLLFTFGIQAKQVKMVI